MSAGLASPVVQRENHTTPSKRGTAMGLARFASVAALLGLCAGASAQTDFALACKSYIDKKGYSADYIEAKTGKRQPGWPARWKSNVEPADVQVGDVVFASFRDSGTAQRVAMVDEVIQGSDGKAAAVIISEWNYGTRYNDKECAITDKFGIASSSRIPVPGILRVWRPSLPLQ
jgi:hypothetical protein